MRINKEVKSKKSKIIAQESQLKEVERKLSALGEKWNLKYNERIIKLVRSIEELNYIADKIIDILEQKLDSMIDVKDIYLIKEPYCKKENW